MIVLLACLFVLVCYKWGDWRNWKTYYPTIMFLIAGDFIHAYVAAAKTLWSYTPKVFPGTITHLVVSLVIYPCIVLLFLPNYPQTTTMKRLRYLSFWVAVFSLLEYFALKFNYMQHFNGWSLLYSVIFDCVLFPLLLIHHRKPQIAWFLSLIFGSVIAYWFKLTPSH